MPLAFVQEQLNNVQVQFRRLGEPDAIGSRRASGRFSDTQCRSAWNRYDMGNGRLTVEHRDCLTPSYGAQVFAEPCLQFGNADLLHATL
jgi:hypothetical protein